MPTFSQKAIELAWSTGAFWAFPNDVTQDKLHLLQPEDPVVVQALIYMAKANTTVYTKAVLNHHNREPYFDGTIGPAMTDLVNTQRCMVPDYAPPEDVAFSFSDPYIQEVCERMQDAEPALGLGNWRNCHNIVNFHCVTVGIDDSKLPSFLKPVWIQVLKNVRQAYAGIGLLCRFIKDGKDLLTGESFTGNINTALSFVTSSDGWIGLAIVGVNETCGSRIWCRYLATYKGGSTDAAITTQWTTLVKHELGHNCGRGHTNGGVMNPSIVNSLPTNWVDNDPSTNWLKQQFGGVPVPIPGDNTPPTPIPLPPTGPKTLEQRLLDAEVKNVVQDVMLSESLRRIKILEEKVA